MISIEYLMDGRWLGMNLEDVCIDKPHSERGIPPNQDLRMVKAFFKSQLMIYIMVKMKFLIRLKQHLLHLLKAPEPKQGSLFPNF